MRRPFSCKFSLTMNNGARTDDLAALVLRGRCARRGLAAGGFSKWELAMPRLAALRRARNRLPLSLESLEHRIVLTTLPAGFVETPVVTSGLSNPTAMEFA